MGRRTEFEYDDLNRVTLVRLPDPDGGGELESPEYTYTYDTMGRLLTETDPLGNVTSHAYDVRNQLTEVTLPDPDGAGPLDYDKAGNLTSRSCPFYAQRKACREFLGKLTG